MKSSGLLCHVGEQLMSSRSNSVRGLSTASETGHRSNSRNGYRVRLWETRVLPGVSRAASRRRKALATVIQEAYIQGVSTRSVDEQVKAMGMTGISKSQVSRLCAEINERVNAFPTRPLEGDWPYLWTRFA
jgi:putative transposase